MLGDNPFEPHDTRLPKHHRAVHVLDVLVEPDASGGCGQELHQQNATARPWLVAQIAAVQLQERLWRALAAEADAQ